MQKKIFSSFGILMIAAILAVPGCNKNSQSTEDNLRISTNTATLNISLAPEFEFNLSVESGMPVFGIRIEYIVKEEVSNQIILQGPAILTQNKITGIVINNLPRQKICVCTITVTSQGRNTNKATTSFRVVYK